MAGALAGRAGPIQLAQHEPADALVSAQRAAVIQRRLGDRGREAVAIDLAGLAYQRLDRHDEAAHFHRRAAVVQRELGDRWQLALTLGQLGEAQEHAGAAEEARMCRQEAVSLLAEFDDQPAITLRERLARLVAAP